MKLSIFSSLFSFAALAITLVGANNIDIPSTAIQNGNFNTLVAALDAAGLVGALSAPEGPFTVFAPTDDAFAALPNGVVECLLDNPNVLTDVLLYHVASGRAFSTDLFNGQRIPTLLQGATVTARVNRNGVRINESSVVIADVEASNGVIHVIDEVLVPGRIDINGLCFPRGGGMTSNNNNRRPANNRPNHNNNNYVRNPVCHWEGATVHAHQWHTGRTQTCYCQPNGNWTNCRANHNQNQNNNWHRPQRGPWNNQWNNQHHNNHGHHHNNNNNNNNNNHWNNNHGSGSRLNNWSYQWAF